MTARTNDKHCIPQVDITVKLMPEICLELLHLDLNTLSKLREACRRRENLFAEIQGKTSYQRSFIPQHRHLSEIKGMEEEDCIKDDCDEIENKTLQIRQKILWIL
ncbi:unnamed protein product [Ceratitis capitata]|uniref:(Mediterranean fruit fly) hypothetical protein n=1 Tax=Ceratitis capitata TaxID=7213 RepID=A0A811URX4_CERCA|nr:unnamed protein product [Ceratitis capitata]